MIQKNKKLKTKIKNNKINYKFNMKKIIMNFQAKILNLSA